MKVENHFQGSRLEFHIVWIDDFQRSMNGWKHQQGCLLQKSNTRIPDVFKYQTFIKSRRKPKRSGSEVTNELNSNHS